jgi:hypothetical protein
MSRLLSYINESGYDDYEEVKDIAEILMDNCAPFLKELKKTQYKYMLYRGYKKDVSKSVEFVKPRKNRRPKDTPLALHNLLDDLFKKKFGWKVRSEGVFVAPRNFPLSDYGRVYLFFPVGKFKYVWSPKVSDLYEELDWITTAYYYDSGDFEAEQAIYNWINPIEDFEEWRSNFDAEKYFLEKLEKIINTYTNKDLSGALIKGRNEMAIQCEEYCLIDEDYDVDLGDYFRKWG